MLYVVFNVYAPYKDSAGTGCEREKRVMTVASDCNTNINLCLTKKRVQGKHVYTYIPSTTLTCDLLHSHSRKHGPVECLTEISQKF